MSCLQEVALARFYAAIKVNHALCFNFKPELKGYSRSDAFTQNFLRDPPGLQLFYLLQALKGPATPIMSTSGHDA